MRSLVRGFNRSTTHFQHRAGFGSGLAGLKTTSPNPRTPVCRAGAWGHAAARSTPGQVLLDLGVAAGNVRALVQPALLLRSQQLSAAPWAGVL